MIIICHIVSQKGLIKRKYPVFAGYFLFMLNPLNLRKHLVPGLIAVSPICPNAKSAMGYANTVIGTLPALQLAVFLDKRQIVGWGKAASGGRVAEAINRQGLLQCYIPIRSFTR